MMNNLLETKKEEPNPLNEWYWKCCNDVFSFIVERMRVENHPSHRTPTDMVWKEHSNLFIMVRTMDKLWSPNLGSATFPVNLISIQWYWHAHVDQMNEMIELADLFAK